MRWIEEFHRNYIHKEYVIFCIFFEFFKSTLILLVCIYSWLSRNMKSESLRKKSWITREVFQDAKQPAIESLLRGVERRGIKPNRFLIQLSIQTLREEPRFTFLVVTFLTRVALEELHLPRGGHASYLRARRMNVDRSFLSRLMLRQESSRLS